MATQDQTETDTEPDEEQAEDEAGRLGLRADTDMLGVALDAIEAVADEAVAEFGPEGARVHVVDPANVLMADVSVPADAFESYAGRDLKLGLRVPRLMGVLKHADAEANIEWDREDYRLRVKAGSLDARLSTLDPTTVRTQELGEDLYKQTTVTFTIDGDDLTRAIRAVDVMGVDVVRLLADEDGFTGVKVRGDTDSVEVEFDAEFSAATEPVESMLSLDYLKEVRKALPKDVELTVHGRTEFPAIIEFDHEGVEVAFLLAPRVESE